MKKFGLLGLTFMLFGFGASMAHAEAVNIAGTGSHVDGGAAVSTTYTFSAGEYQYTIQGFGPGDALVLPAITPVSINNKAFGDTALDIEALTASGLIIVHLTGIPLTTNTIDNILDATDFKDVFGAASLPTLPGDANGDNVINVSDALLTLQYAVNLTNFAVCDVYPLGPDQKPYGDNKVDARDALLILRKALKLSSWL